MLDGTVQTTVINGVSPIGSAKTAASISVGNCSGVVVNEGSGIYEIVAYSNNGSAVNQNITVAGNSVNLNFTNYIVESCNPNSINLDTMAPAGLSNPAPHN
jgi:actin-like ATPase involved in cell morphogenesis